MGRSLSIIKCCSAFLTALSTRQVLVLSHLHYCSVVWSGATKRENCNCLNWPLYVHRELTLITCRSNLSWLKVEERLTTSQLVFVIVIDMLNTQSCRFELLVHSLDTHAYPTRHATIGLFTVPKSRTDYGRRTVPHRPITTWNSIPHQVTHASSKI
jgi:hypothetical protein